MQAIKSQKFQCVKMYQLIYGNMEIRMIRIRYKITWTNSCKLAQRKNHVFFTLQMIIFCESVTCYSKTGTMHGISTPKLLKCLIAFSKYDADQCYFNNFIRRQTLSRLSEWCPFLLLLSSVITAPCTASDTESKIKSKRAGNGNLFGEVRILISNFP